MVNNNLFYEFKDEIKNFMYKISINQKIVIFGTGALADKYVKYFDLKVNYYIDNNPSKHGNLFNDSFIYGPEYIIRNNSENVLILIASEAHAVISEQLENMGFIYKKSFYKIDDFFDMLQERAILEYACEDDYIYSKNCGPRILYDVTITIKYNNIGGILRAVLNVIREGYKQKDIPFIAVQRAGITLMEPINWLMQNNVTNGQRDNLTCKKIKYNKNDILIFLDATWEHDHEKYNQMVKNAKIQKVKVINGIYDMIPITDPYAFEESICHKFKNMLENIFLNSDGIVTDSKSVANEVINYIEENNFIFSKKFSIGWFHNGTDLKRNINISIVKEEIKNIFKSKTFLMVGTIEPRKGHEIVLEAFERLWGSGYNYKLCIAGKIGWKVEKFIAKLVNHKELSKQLFFINSPSEEELIYCYENASALIFASKAEGFGLPIIEAAQFSLPLILSDIPVFKEIAGDKAVYFEVFNSKSLADAILKWNQLYEQNQIMDSSQIEFQTWEETFKQILGIIINKNWYKVYN